MSCDGFANLNPMCLASEALSNQATGAMDSAFSHVAGYSGLAAGNATAWLWKQIDTATTLDLHSPELLREMAATGAIAAVLCLGLFLIQVITSVLRREPGSLGRAVNGLVVSFVGSALALAATRVLLGAVDSLSAGVVEYTMGTNISGLGRKLAFAELANIQNPAVTLLFSVVILYAVVVVWAAMMIRKLILLISAVLAPLAFAGATADITRNWARKWVEFVAAMIVSKLLLVIILSIGISVINGAGQVAHPGPTQAATQLAGGSLVLLMGGFAPWVAIRMFSFADDSLHAAHATAAQTSAGARTVISAPQKVSAIQWQTRSLMPSSGSRASGQPSALPEGYETLHPTATTTQGAVSAGGRGAAGAAGASGGAAAAATPAAPAVAAVAAPVVAAVAAAQAGKSITEKTITAVNAAQPTNPPSGGRAPQQPPKQP